jgi:hypothetical protein
MMIFRKKNIAGVITLMIAIMSFWGCAQKEDRIVGEWTGKDGKGETVNIIFDNTHHATIIIGNNVIGGNGSMSNGHPVEITYKTDDETSPHIIEFAMEETDTKRKGTMLRGIYRMLSDHKMEVRLNFYGMDSEFKNFDPDDANNILMNKVD